MKSAQPLYWRANPGPGRPSGVRPGGLPGVSWDQLAGPARPMLSFDAGGGVFRRGRSPLDVMGEYCVLPGCAV